MVPLQPLSLTTSLTQTLSPTLTSVLSAMASMAVWNLALTCDTSTLPWFTTGLYWHLLDPDPVADP